MAKLDDKEKVIQLFQSRKERDRAWFTHSAGFGSVCGTCRHTFTDGRGSNHEKIMYMGEPFCRKCVEVFREMLKLDIQKNQADLKNI